MAAERPSNDGFAPAIASRERNHMEHDSHISSKTHDAHHHHHHHRPTMPDIDREAFIRLEQQVSYNYSVISRYADSLARFDQAFTAFQSDITRDIDEVKAELRARAPATTNGVNGRSDPGDIDVLAGQIASVTTKANEIDNLKTQLELLKRKIKRLEDDADAVRTQQAPRPLSALIKRLEDGAVQHVPRPLSASSHRGSATHESVSSHPPLLSSHSSGPSHTSHTSYQSLPPIQTGTTPSSVASPDHARSYRKTPVLDHAPAPHRHYSDRSSSGDRVQNAPVPYIPAHRSNESLSVPASGLPAWRTSAQSPQYPPSATREGPEPQSATWQTASNGVAKRPYEDVRELSTPASPKRPKLAPLKPRNSLGEDGYISHPHPADVAALPPRNPYEVPPANPAPVIAPTTAQQSLATPASATSAPSSFRFITSTGSNDDQWRSYDGANPARGRGRGRGKSRPRGNRLNDERSTPEWDVKPSDWQAAFPPQKLQHMSPNGGAYYTSTPRSAAPASRPGEGLQQHDYPLTPIASAVSPQDQSSLVGNDPNGSGKKTRTKPTRNSEGVLIRKDGRPDMRSVSSANNLRKVHAKKEAERAEIDGRGPLMLNRSLAPASSHSQSASASDDEEHQRRDTEDRMDTDESRSATPQQRIVNGDRDGAVERRDDSAAGSPPKPQLVKVDSSQKSDGDDKWYKMDITKMSHGEMPMKENVVGVTADRRDGA